MNRYDTGREVHIAISVDIDRFSDEQLRDFLGHFVRAGKAQTLEQVRALCAEAREQGYEVFPPCDHTDAKGHCTGHQTYDARSDTWGT